MIYPRPALLSLRRRFSATLAEPLARTQGGGNLAYRRFSGDIAIIASYVALALLVTGRFWRHATNASTLMYPGEPAQVQWFLAHAVRSVVQLDNPFTTQLLNAPDGVRFAADAPMLGLTLPAAPFTHLFGTGVSYLLLVTVSLAATATAWYYVLSRHIVDSKVAAAVGAGFCGFAPAMLTHAAWHPALVAQFLVPFIVWRTIRLGEPGRALPNGVILGLLVAWQGFISRQILLLTAICVIGFCVAYALQRRDQLRSQVSTFLAGLGVSVLTAGIPLAAALLVRPTATDGVGNAMAGRGADVFSFITYGSEAIAGNRGNNAGLAPSYAEESTFFGLGLLIILAGLVAWQWRDPVIRTLAGLMAFFAVLSLGDTVRYQGFATGIPAPYHLVRWLPGLDGFIPARMGLVVTALAGVLLALGIQRLLSAATDAPLLRGIATVALVVALLPLGPTPLVATVRPVPEFITSGHWRPFVAQGQSLVPVPLPSGRDAGSVRWPAAQQLGFAIPAGDLYAPPRPTARLLEEVARTGKTPDVSEAMRDQLRLDIGHWNAAVLVVDLKQQNAIALRDTLNSLVGPGRQIDDVWMWDVRKS